MKSFKDFLNDSRLEKPKLEQAEPVAIPPKVDVPKPQPAVQPRVQRNESVVQPRVQPPVESVAKPKQNVKKVISEWTTQSSGDPTVIPSHETQAPVEVPDLVRKMCGLDEPANTVVNESIEGELTEAEKIRKLCGFEAQQPTRTVNEARKKDGPLQIDDISFVWGASNDDVPQGPLTEQEKMRRICGF